MLVVKEVAEHYVRCKLAFDKYSFDSKTVLASQLFVWSIQFVTSRDWARNSAFQSPRFFDSNPMVNFIHFVSIHFTDKSYNARSYVAARSLQKINKSRQNGFLVDKLLSQRRINIILCFIWSDDNK